MTKISHFQHPRLATILFLIILISQFLHWDKQTSVEASWADPYTRGSILYNLVGRKRRFAVMDKLLRKRRDQASNQAKTLYSEDAAADRSKHQYADFMTSGTILNNLVG
ncbi:unnamed protein product [Meloidogyne enterolobii]|uniref:Uncharacterized protein n=1 Tax=Meloidogyne enterolobii TaxID=390850 RepID=A0ACB1ARA8_MELEN